MTEPDDVMHQWGPFRHSNGVICCGTLRVAKADFDTNPPENVQKEILDALCGVHPAPAPASLRDMTEADFDKAHGIAPAGVPDVDGLIERARSKTYREGPDEIYYNLPNLHDELADALEIVEGENRVMRQREQTMLERQATALAALQSELSRETFRKIDQIRINQDIRRENAQQAERIKELEAKLAEAVGLLEKAYLWVDSPTQLNGELTDFLAKAREGMG